MSLPGIIRRLSYHPWFIRAVRGLGLREPARKLYHRLASSRRGFLRLERGGLTASFITRTSEQLRAVEAASMERGLDLLARRLQPGDTMYDVGSHVGVYSVLLAKVVGEKGTVVAFEPHHETYEQLLENARLNGLRNVRAFEQALGEQAGDAKLYVGKVIANFSLLRGAIVGAEAADAPFEFVQVVPGDEFVEAESLPIPRAVKIDVEGFEYAVLKGLRRTLAHPKCAIVCCEVHPGFLPRHVRPSDITELLSSLGYRRIEGGTADRPYQVVGFKGQ